MADLLILYIASIFTFMLYGWDKHLAIYDRSRVPESILMVFTLLGGAFGALCGMILFKHKVTKPLFYIGVPITLAIQLAIIVLYRVFVL